MVQFHSLPPDLKAFKKEKKRKRRTKTMARFNPNEADKYSSNSGSEWLKLQNDGDVASVQFLTSNFEDLDTFACHRVKVGDKERWVSCNRNYDDPIDQCPLCELGSPVKPVLMLAMYDREDKKVKIWERGKKFIPKMQALFNRFGDLRNLVVEIERHGAKGSKETQYDLIPRPDLQPVDISDVEKPEFLGTVILEKTNDELIYYIDNGDFPKVDSDSKQEEEPVRRRSSYSQQSSGEQRQGSRFSGSRFSGGERF